MTESRAVFFLSTGRCGTQSIAHVLKQLCGDQAVVEHEPIEFEYHPNRYFRRKPDEYLRNPDAAFMKHLERIKTILKDKHYIEIGWPCYSHIPMFIEALNNNVQVVHLLRHPVKVAASLMTHDFYNPGNTNGFNIYGTLDPSREGAFLPQYVSRWIDMSRFEKCLYHWAEINRYGLWLRETYPDIQFLQIKAEELFDNAGAIYRDIMNFIGLDQPGDLNEKERHVDNYSRKTRDDIDPELIKSHPEIIKLMDIFGYSEVSITDESMQRYKKHSRLRRWLKKMLQQ